MTIKTTKIEWAHCEPNTFIRTAETGEGYCPELQATLPNGRVAYIVRSAMEYGRTYFTTYMKHPVTGLFVVQNGGNAFYPDLWVEEANGNAYLYQTPPKTPRWA